MNCSNFRLFATWSALLGAFAAQAVAQEKVAEPSSFVFGKWVDARTYENNFALPLRITLSGNWVRVPPPGTRLFVLRNDNQAATDPAAEADPAQLRKAFVFWAQRDLRFRLATLGVEFHGMRKGQTFDEAAQEQMDSSVASDARRPGLLRDPFVRKQVAWICGRRCWQFDVDGFYESGAFHKRYYFIPSKTVLISIAWALTDPGERSSVDEWMHAMCQIGADFQPSRAEQQDTARVVNEFRSAESTASNDHRYQKLLTEIRDQVDLQAASILSVQDWSTEPDTGGIGGIAQRYGNAAGDKSAMKHMIQGQVALDRLLVERERLLLSHIWKSLDENSRVVARKLFPEFSTRAENKKTWSAYSPKSKAFRVEFPGTPIARFTAEEEQIELAWFDEEYRVVRRKLPTAISKQIANLDQVLEIVSAMMQQEQTASIETKEDTTIDGRAAKELVMTIRGGDGTSSRNAMRVLLVGDNLFMVSARMPSTGEASRQTDARKFLESFHVND